MSLWASSRPLSAFFTCSAWPIRALLGAPKDGIQSSSRGALTLLVPMFALIAAILVLSFFPKLVMEPISAAIDPYFSSTLVWQGMSLEMIYGYWNPVPVMAAAMMAAAVLFGFVWLLQNSRRHSPTGVADFYASCRAGLCASRHPACERILGWCFDADLECCRIDAKALHRERPDLLSLRALLHHCRLPAQRIWHQSVGRRLTSGGALKRHPAPRTLTPLSSGFRELCGRGC